MMVQAGAGSIGVGAWPSRARGKRAMPTRELGLTVSGMSGGFSREVSQFAPRQVPSPGGRCKRILPQAAIARPPGIEVGGAKCPARAAASPAAACSPPCALGSPAPAAARPRTPPAPQQPVEGEQHEQEHRCPRPQRPFLELEFSGFFPTRRSSAAIRASYSWIMLAASTSSSKAPVPYFSTQIRIRVRDRSWRRARSWSVSPTRYS